MVSFSCEACGDVLTKGKLDKHKNQCRKASFTCLDCMVHFWGNDYKTHTSCVSEAQKYQGHMYKPDKEKKGKAPNKKSATPAAHTTDASKSMRPLGAYVEDALDEGEGKNAVAIVEVPPRAPTPPPSGPADGVNVFEFLVKEVRPSDAPAAINAPASRRQTSQYSRISSTADSQYTEDGYAYGHGPVLPAFERYESWNQLTGPQGSQTSMAPPAYATPAPKQLRREQSDKSEKKRKRNVEDLDLSSAKRPASRDAAMPDAPPSNIDRVLHSGLTGGLTKLLTNVEGFDPRDRIDAGPTPISPAKRSKRDRDAREEKRKSSYVSYGPLKSVTTTSSHHGDKDRRSNGDAGSSHATDRRVSQQRPRSDSVSSTDEPSTISNRRSRIVEFQPSQRPGSVQPTAANRVVRYSSRAEMFLSFVNKGPESERGVSMNKALKRYHRERDVKGEQKEEDNKDLWKSLRLRRNSRGEIVLFI